MGLFDELLKKPPQPSTDGSSREVPIDNQSQPGDNSAQSISAPVKIEKTEEQSIMTETKTLPSTPSEPTMVAEENVSSVLVQESDPLASESAPIEDIPSIDNAPKDSITEQEPQMEQIQQETPDPIIASGQEVVESENKNAESLSDFFNQNTTMPESTAPSLLNLGMDEEKEEEKANAPVSEKKATIEEFRSLTAYIQANIEQDEVLIGKLDAAHTAKLEEASEYKSEKERFAGLEEKAYQDAERMMIEKAHAERLKAYFVEQLNEANSDATAEIKIKPTKEEVKEKIVEEKIVEQEPFYDEPPYEEDVTLIDDTSEITGSVETALTGIAVQETVKNTVEKKHPKVKKEVKKEEFSLV